MHNQFDICIATGDHQHFAVIIAAEMESSAKARGTGIAKRTAAYIAEKILEGKAVIAFNKEGIWAGFCYIETWSHGQYVANSGLIVAPQFRKVVWQKLSRKKYLRLAELLILIQNYLD